MEERYKLMLADISAAVGNLDNVFTASEYNSSLPLLSSAKRSIDLLEQTMALRDCIVRLNELFWLVGSQGLDPAESKKGNLRLALCELSTNQTSYLDRLRYWGDKTVSVSVYRPFATKVKVSTLLEEITVLCRVLSKNYFSESI
ncbi:hypothetical protein [Dyadobacter psychrotolerans]|uniref:Uncharacterized protein n=1 Tax=Dyadobacter psychrotolerans TaxID=2541721 RepID=A0A4R5DRE3_9BACT|nr:hypothetical protein [Dyadobacter psychrotolerans]TDE14864.1 hypothetical protein E0F88_16935 [Dyadobacter psychrotolerans]